jgi:hypothetical protein
MDVLLLIITLIITYYDTCFYIIITCFTDPLIPIATAIMDPLLPAITRSILGNDGLIITYY